MEFLKSIELDNLEDSLLMIRARLQIMMDRTLFVSRFVYYFLTSMFKIIWSLLFTKKILIPPYPLTVEMLNLIEWYSSEIKVTGLEKFEPEQPKGKIEVTIPFDKNKHVPNQVLSTNRHNRLEAVEQLLSSAELGELIITDYGGSNLNKQTYLTISDDIIYLEVNTQEVQVPDIRITSNFDTVLSYDYYPEPLQKVLVNLDVELLDSDADNDEQTINKINFPKKEINGQSLLEQIKKQVDVNPELIIRLKPQVLLPRPFACSFNSLKIDYMTLSWPISLPHWKTELFLNSSSESESINYNPDQHLIKWENVQLDIRKPYYKDYIMYSSNLIRLKVKDPSEIYLLSKLTGKIYIELDGLLSGLNLYHNLFRMGTTRKEKTILETKYNINLEECFTHRHFYPKQHLYFPGVVLDNARISDVFMLLRDKGFDVIDEGGISSHQELTTNKLSEYRQIKATKAEGSKKLVLWLFMEGFEAKTIRERKVEGENQYTTQLPTGSMVVDIWGQLQGDYKRVVNVINEIQTQLKEQFRHVSIPD